MNNEFLKTPAHKKILMFMRLIDKSIKEEKQHKNTKISHLLKEVDKIIESTPLDKEPQRYGNTAARKVQESISKMHISTHKEITPYFIHAFGNKERIDYGTGHELNFLCFLFCLCELQEIQINEAFYALKEYFQVIRKFIHKYNLEPAGSHGLWGIDDYQLLPFVYGSSELYDTNTSFEELFDAVNADLEYSSALRFCELHKNRNNREFREHSPVLYALRDRSWCSVNYGLMIMYEREVLEKGVVTQHFIYSSYLPK